MFKKILSILLVAAMLVTMCMAFASCGQEQPAETTKGNNEETPGAVDYSNFKIGVILLHDENSTYDLNFLNGIKAVKEELKLKDSQVIIKTNVGETVACQEAAEELADEGCKVVFANSFGHEDHMINAAKEFPNVQFCHATGTKAHTAGVANFHNAFASIYEGRFLAGIAAGMKLNAMIEAGEFTAEEAKIGYVGAFTYAEVMSGYTSFYLGAKSVCPTVTMDVKFTGSWFDPVAERNAAIALIEGGCKLISQHADSMGAPSACEEMGIPNVSYNGSTKDACPNTFIVSSRIDWAPYFKYIIEQANKGEAIATDWTGTLATGSVALTEVNTAVAAPGTVEAIEAAKAKLASGELKVFNTDNFAVAGEKLTSYMADVDTDAAFAKDTEVIADGYFHESEKRSAPYFDIEIDGITLLDRNYG